MEDDGPGSGRLGDALDQIDDGLLALDREWRLTYLNRGAARHLGGVPADALGRAIWEAVPTLAGSAFEAAARAARAGGAVVEVELSGASPTASIAARMLPTRDGLVVLLHAVAESARSRRGSPGAPAAPAVDEASRIADAVDACRGRDEVLAAVSHDLRNPLNTIVLCARMLSRAAPCAELDAIRASAARADRLVQDLLAAASLEHGRLPLALGLEALLPILEEVAGLHRVLAAARAVAIEVVADEGLPPMSVDRHRVVQALSNLVGNAIRFAPAHSAVCLRARRAGRGVELDVADRGPGIPAAQLPRVFDRFWRGAAADDGGVGLGLAIARGVAEAHGGSLRVASAPGEGATFTLSLPQA